MTNILILEDEEISRNALVRILEELRTDIEVYAAATLEKARSLLHGDVEFELFLLDVNLEPENMEDVSGIVFAGEVRAIHGYEFTPIVMVTSVPAMEMTAYRQIHCYQYILKPFEKEDVEAVATKVIEHLEEKESNSIIVKKDGINYSIQCEEIVYCKAAPRGVLLCLQEEEVFAPYLSIKQLMKKLPTRLFFQCHRMYVVNKQYVQYYDMVNQIIRVKEESIDIGVTYKADVRRLLNG